MKNITNKRYFLSNERILELKGKGFKIQHKKIYFYAQNANGKYRKFKIMAIKDIIRIENL